jgi:hypothetical protein
MYIANSQSYRKCEVAFSDSSLVQTTLKKDTTPTAFTMIRTEEQASTSQLPEHTMNPNSNQQMRQPQGQPQGGGQGSLNGAPSAALASSASQQSMMAQHQHMLGPISTNGVVCTNPALAAAVAASALIFPPAAMLANPGAFLAMAQHHQPGTAFTGLPPQTTSTTMILPSYFDPKKQQGVTPIDPSSGSRFSAPTQQQPTILPFAPGSGGSVRTGSVATLGAVADERSDELTSAERAKQCRERNREHARSTRLRKKAYVQELKELVENLHAERTNEVRQRRVAVERLAEQQTVRRGAVRTFLRYHSDYEKDQRKWLTVLEDNFWLKQPVTPFRSFRRAEIEKVSWHDLRVTCPMKR